jgi:hypothetical protein
MTEEYGLRLFRKLYELCGLSRGNIYANKPLHGVLPANAANQKIHQAIVRGEPFMVSRFGTTEALAILNSYDLQLTHHRSLFVRLHATLQGRWTLWQERVKQLLHDNAGFFPVTDSAMAGFEACYSKTIPLIDMLGVWGFVPGENYLIRTLCPGATLFNPKALEPYFFDPPWSSSLAGKRVLVIHPFAKTIESQFFKRKTLFQNPQVLPEFDLKTMVAVQSLAGTTTPFPDWFEALNWMKRQMDKTEFDVAIVGAGAYGLPLCAHAKLLGKIGIHIGGATQILFGIRGKRWDDMPEFAGFFNEDWVRPAVEEMIINSRKIEDGCYW